MFKKNKGQVELATIIGVVGVVITLVALGIVLSTSQKSMATIRDTVAENKQNNKSTEKLTFTNGTAVATIQKDLVSGSVVVWSSSAVGSQNITLNAGRNYTINLGGGSITPINETVYDWFNNTVFYANYSYYYGSAEKNITQTGQQGIESISQFQPTFAIVIATFVVIMLVLGLAALIYNKMG